MKAQVAPAASNSVNQIVPKADPPTPIIIKPGGDDSGNVTAADNDVLIQTALIFTPGTETTWENSVAGAPGKIENVLVLNGSKPVFDKAISPTSDLVSVTLFYGDSIVLLAEQVNTTTGVTEMTISSPNSAFSITDGTLGKGWTGSKGSFSTTLTRVLIMSGDKPIKDYHDETVLVDSIVNVTYNLT